MHTGTTARHFIIILLALYLFLPWAGITSAVALEPAATALSAMDVPAPCPDCPCSGTQESGCGHTPCCPCSCHAPSDQLAQSAYAPLVLTQRPFERHRALPQVYRTIFVPPQNRV